ncbi:MAG: hypothetical protein QG599_2601 [Pseudomonadota bacterium]|nr:hypothetical protein [Pseudomonadota bacterium]
MSKVLLQPCVLNEKVAYLLGLPAVALQPGVEFWVSDTNWLWFEPSTGVAIWQGLDVLHGFPADSLEAALESVAQQALESHV